jgi:hypothetical protein
LLSPVAYRAAQGPSQPRFADCSRLLAVACGDCYAPYDVITRPSAFTGLGPSRTTARLHYANGEGVGDGSPLALSRARCRGSGIPRDRRFRFPRNGGHLQPFPSAFARGLARLARTSIARSAGHVIWTWDQLPSAAVRRPMAARVTVIAWVVALRPETYRRPRCAPCVPASGPTRSVVSPRAGGVGLTLARPSSDSLNHSPSSSLGSLQQTLARLSGSARRSAFSSAVSPCLAASRALCIFHPGLGPASAALPPKETEWIIAERTLGTGCLEIGADIAIS